MSRSDPSPNNRQKVEHSPVTGRGVEVAGPLAIVVGTYLLFAGHNNPGGGFAAGLVFGAVVTLRGFAGLSRPRNANALLAFGILVVAAVAVVPMVTGNPMLDQSVWSFEAPILGKIKSGSALPFDIGVTAIVVGLVVALLNGMTAADRERAQAESQPHPQSATKSAGTDL